MRIPCVKLTVYASNVSYSQAKAGHWETEKAEYENIGFSLIGVSHKTCFGVVLYRGFPYFGSIFVCILQANYD